MPITIIKNKHCAWYLLPLRKLASPFSVDLYRFLGNKKFNIETIQSLTINMWWYINTRPCQILVIRFIFFIRQNLTISWLTLMSMFVSCFDKKLDHLDRLSAKSFYIYYCAPYGKSTFSEFASKYWYFLRCSTLCHLHKIKYHGWPRAVITYFRNLNIL